MFAARLAFRKHGPTVTPFTGASLTNGPSEPIEGSVQSLAYSFTGGVGPFTVTLRNQASTSRNTQTAASGNFSYTTNRNDSYLYFTVVDSLGTTLDSTSYGQIYYLYPVWNDSVTLSANSYTPAPGTTTTLSTSSSISAAGARTYEWFYRYSTNGGASYSSYAAFGGSGPTQVTGTNIAGERYQYIVNQTNAAGMVQSNMITVVVT